jgi:hypothetical protein
LPGGGPVRALAIDHRLWAIVADVPADRFSGEQLEQELQDIEGVSRYAVAHASTIEFFFRRAPVIPLALFTLFSTDSRARAHLARRRTALRKLFRGLRGREEWGIRITGRLEPSHQVSAPPSTGRGYLERKRRLRALPPPLVTRREIGAAMKVLARLATKVRKESFPTPGPGQPFVSGASFLVATKRRTSWTAQAARVAASLQAHGHRLEANGPWPPYHFVRGSRKAR